MIDAAQLPVGLFLMDVYERSALTDLHQFQINSIQPWGKVYRVFILAPVRGG